MTTNAAEPASDTHRRQPDDAAEYHRQRSARFASRQAQLERQDRLLGRVRLAVFLLAGSLFLLGALSGTMGYHIAGGVVLAGFVALVTWHDYVTRDLERARQIRQINDEAVARLERRWEALPQPSPKIPPAYQATANDLDLFGHASLFQLMCCAGTPVGVDVLRDWLLYPADPDEVRARQLAAVELAPRIELREQLMLEARLLSGGGEALQRFIQWAESDLWLARRPWLVWTCRVLPLIALSLLGLTLASILPADQGGMAIAVVLVLNFGISVFFSGKVHDVFNSVSRRRGEAQRYLQLFEMLYSIPDNTSKLEAIKQDVTRRGGGVLPQMRNLNRIMSLAGISHSPLLFIVAYLPLQLVTLYDFHVLSLLETWQRRHGQHVRQWLNALGQFEALASLAMLVRDHPDWTMPEVDIGTPHLQATGLGHPLLSSKSRVTNDVQVGPTGTFLLVTGSNMSGKSTLLRSIGVNAVLAQAGGPVCARRLTMPPLELATSMRIHDSLEDGVSFFMAELKRLKQIVDHARQLDQREDRTLLYLLDEILQGTNSQERHIAVVRVLHHLLQHHAIGAVSTHDLALATSEQLSGSCQAVHFRETLHDGQAEQAMTFDYQLRKGVATTTNALKLLNIVGLGEDT
jgi:hypothetical protein